MHRAPVPLLILLAACPGSSTSTASTAPAPTVAVRLTPDTSSYAIVLRRRVEQEFQGQTLTSELRAALAVRAVLAQGPAGFVATLTVDSATVDQDSAPSSEASDALRGATITAVVTPDGEIRDLAADRASGDLLDRLIQALRDFYPRTPPGGARPGTSWSDSASYPGGSAGLTLAFQADNRRTVADWELDGTRRALPVATETAYTLTGSGERSGQQLELTGAGRRHARRRLSAEGRYLGGVTVDSALIEIRLSSGTVIPVRQWTVDSVEAR